MYQNFAKVLQKVLTVSVLDLTIPQTGSAQTTTLLTILLAGTLIRASRWVRLLYLLVNLVQAKVLSALETSSRMRNNRAYTLFSLILRTHLMKRGYTHSV